LLLSAGVPDILSVGCVMDAESMELVKQVKSILLEVW
jgi:hypothetical protein